MKSLPSSLVPALLAASIVCAGSASFAVEPPRFYPAANAPLAGEPFLAEVESAFVAGMPQPTLVFPLPLTGARLATRAEFLTALEAAISADPANTAGIVRAARKVARVSDGTHASRPVPADVADIIAAAGNVAAALPYFGEILDALLDEDPAETVTTTSAVMGTAALAGAAPADLGAMARKGIAALTKGFKAADAPFEEMSRAVLVGTVTSDLTGTENAEIASEILTGIIRGIRDLGLETPLLDDVTRGAARALGSMPDVTMTDIATAAFTEATPGRHHAILVAAACVGGTPFFYLEPTIADEVSAAGTAVRPAFSTEISTAASHALNIRVNEVKVAGSETLARIKTDGTALSDAIVCAALMAGPTQAYEILRAGFDGAYGPGITRPAAPFPAWLKIAMSGNPKFSADALSLVIATGNADGLFANGVTVGDVTGAVLGSRSPLSTVPVLEEVQKLIQSGEAIDLLTQAGSLTTAIAASPEPSEVAGVIAPLFAGASALPAKEDALKMALLAVSDASLRGAIAAAAVLADPANASAYSAAALIADPSVADNTAISAAISAVNQIGAVATQPRWKIASAMRSVIAARPGQPLAIVFGARLAAPRQVLPILAAAMSADASFDFETARTLDPGHAVPLALASKIAAAEVLDVAAPGTTLAMLFDTVEGTVLAHRTEIADLTVAAVIGAPRYAHHTLHAAAFRYPEIALRTVENTFDAAPIAAPGNQTARAAALGAALINGLREARTGTLAANQMRLAVGAAVKVSRALTGPAVATSIGIPGRSRQITSNGPAAVITGAASQLVTPADTTFRASFLLTTAVGKAPGFALSMAQAAAQAAVSIAGGKVNTNSIVAAVAAGGVPFSAAQIRSAAMFGKLQARRTVPGAGADGVLDYSHRGSPTDPVESLDGL